MTTKSIFTSVTFWGIVTSGLAMLMPKLFVMLGMDAPTTAATIVQLIGYGVAIWGRFRANTLVTVTGAPAVPSKASPPTPPKA